MLAVVPARGGSKGVKKKNLRKVGGESLVGLVGKVVKRLEWIDRAVVSTDSKDIATVAREAGLTVPFMRPEDISGDRISDWAVLSHALDAVEEIDDRRYDVIVMLQPTSPLRKPEHVTATVDKLIRFDYDAVWTVSPTDTSYHPLKALTLDGNDRLNYYDARGAQIIARQQLDRLYHRNGIAYAITRECIKNQRMIKGKKTGAVVIEEPVVSIDTERDLQLADFLMTHGK